MWLVFHGFVNVCAHRWPYRGEASPAWSWTVALRVTTGPSCGCDPENRWFPPPTCPSRPSKDAGTTSACTGNDGTHIHVISLLLTSNLFCVGPWTRSRIYTTCPGPVSPERFCLRTGRRRMPTMWGRVLTGRALLLWAYWRLCTSENGDSLYSFQKSVHNVMRKEC